MFNIPDAPVPTEGQALDFMTDKLRVGGAGRNSYEVYVWTIAEHYVRTHVTAPQSFGIQNIEVVPKTGSEVRMASRSRKT
jgi:hypothetical protein